MNRCLHEKMELVEVDGDDVYARCENCKLLFKFTKKQWEEEYGKV